MPSVFARISSLLFENARLELISKQFGYPVEEIERWKEADPTSGKYLTWIVRQVKQGGIRFPEDYVKVFNALRDFDQAKKSPQFSGPKDINQYKRYGDLAQALQAASGTDLRSKGEVRRHAATTGMKALPKKVVGTYVNGKMSEATVYEVTTFEALDALGAQRTEWCVKDEKYFNQYAKQGLPYYMLVNDDDGQPLELLHLPSGQCMDRWDSPTEPTHFEAVGIDCFETLTPSRMIGRLELAANHKDGDFQTILGKILKLVSNPNSMVSIFGLETLLHRDRSTGPCFFTLLRRYAPEQVDAAVMKSTEGGFAENTFGAGSMFSRLCDYAHHCVKGRFPAFEEAFQKAWDSRSLSYARHLESAVSYEIDCYSKDDPPWEWLSETLLKCCGADQLRVPGATAIPYFKIAWYYFSHQNERCTELEQLWTQNLSQFQISSYYLNGDGNCKFEIGAYESTFGVTIPQ